MRELRKHNRMCHFWQFWLQIISLTLVIHGYSVTGAAPPNVPHFRSRDEGPQRPPVKYKYSYNIRNTEGDQHGHQAAHDGPFASGKYYVKLNQGTSQNVEYYTDQLGYHPKVEYRSQLDSGKSGARVILGGDANSYSTSTIKHDFKKSSDEYTSTEAPSTLADVSTARPVDSSTAQSSFDSVSGSINPNFGLRVTGDTPFGSNGTTINSYFGYTLNPSDVTPTNQSNEVFSAPTDPPSLVSLAQAANVPADAYLQPEYNEITNGFLGKIVSVVPGIKFLRPIIVTDSGQSQAINGSADTKSDQVVDSAQLHELHQASPYAQLILAGVSVLDPKNENISALTPEKDEGISTEPPSADQEPEKPKTIVDVEPQTIEKQAVITTNIDISKSVPLNMNFLPEVDNNLNEPRTNGLNYPTNELVSNEQQRPIFSYPPINPLQASNSINYQGALFGQPPQQLEATLGNYPGNENPQGINSLSPQLNSLPPQFNSLPPQLNSLPPQLNFLGPPGQQGQYLNTIGPGSQTLFGIPPRFLQLPFQQNLQTAPTFIPPQNAPPLAAPDFRFVSIPILQHQPNVIPLNYANNAPQSLPEAGAAPTNSPQAAESDQSVPPTDPVSTAESSPTQETIIKRENYSSDKANSISSDPSPANSIRPSFIEPAFHSQQPLAYQVPAAQLIPYVKQITNSPQMLQVHPYAHFLRQQLQPQQQLQLRSSPVRPHSVSYSVRQFPKDQYRKPLTKSAPFKPSHPVWDSIYPPQHMYQVPYYVIDKIPNERKARDSTYRRNQRRVRRLFVEYGGFKPPMIPSTLLEVEETSDSTEVPTNAAES